MSIAIRIVSADQLGLAARAAMFQESCVGRATAGADVLFARTLSKSVDPRR
jgi:hypothetical protein